MEKRLYPLVFSFLFLLGLTKAQNPQFAQPYNSTLLLNPALTGAINARNRLSVNRREWESYAKPSLTAASYEHRLSFNTGDYVGIGGHFRQREYDALKQKQLGLGIAYAKYLGGAEKNNAHYLMAGADIGWQQTVLDLNQSRDFNYLSTYYNIGSFPFPIIKLDSIYIATGFLWSSVWKNGSSAHAGVALHRVFEPVNRVLFYDFHVPIKWEYTVHFGGEIPLKPQIRLVSTAIFTKQGDKTDIRNSLALKLTAKDTLSLQAGGIMRFTNTTTLSPKAQSLTIFFRLDWLRYTTGFSFDNPMSSTLEDAYLNKAKEFFLIYRFGALGNKRFRVPNW